MKILKHTGVVVFALGTALILSSCGTPKTTDFTVEQCAEVMAAYMETDSIAMFTCRQYLEQVGQETFNADIAKLSVAVSEGHTMKSDLEAGINQFESDLGLNP